jgi:ornithine cyclodeaminase/alanine dehydrogenase-like protein (mu-crystallin family)
MPLYLTEADVEATFTMPDALRVLTSACHALSNGTAENAPRQRVKMNGSMLQVMPAALDGRAGYKSYTVAPRGPRFWFTLYGANGEMLAIIEANRLGQIRTGAASGVATAALARTDATTLGVIGTGYQARTQIEAICAARPIERVRVWGRDPQRLATFVQDVTAQLGRPIDAAAGPQEAIAGADVVATMTSALRPVFDGAWLAPGAHVNAAGSNRANAMEIDVETVRRAAVVAVEDVAQAKVESGDLRAANEAGAFRWLDAVRLADIVAGAVIGRTSDDQVTLFESLGIGLWDIAAANHIYDACLAAGRGTQIAFPS